MAASPAPIAETWPENVLTSIVSRKCASQKIIACPTFFVLFVFSSFFWITFGSGWIFCTKCNFLLPLRQLIFRQKQPGHWVEVVCHFHLSFNAPTDTYFSFSHFSFLIFLHKAIPVSKSSIICKFLIYKTFIVFVKASRTKDSKGLVVLTTPLFGGYTSSRIVIQEAEIQGLSRFATSLHRKPIF